MRRAERALLWPALWLVLVACGCGGGGSSPQETCSDGQQNQNETDVDCGGVCTPCANGLGCLTDSDCASGNCDNGRCALPGESCTVGETRCNADGNVETCADPGDHWDETACARGCQVVAGQAQCIPEPGCSEGQTRCSAGGDLETCNADGQWEITDCPHGCVTEGGQSRCADAPSAALPGHVKQTAGGCQVDSAGFRARLCIGAPLPGGTTGNGALRASPGPAAAP